MSHIAIFSTHSWRKHRRSRATARRRVLLWSCSRFPPCRQKLPCLTEADPSCILVHGENRNRLIVLRSSTANLLLIREFPSYEMGKACIDHQQHSSDVSHHRQISGGIRDNAPSLHDAALHSRLPRIQRGNFPNLAAARCPPCSLGIRSTASSACLRSP